MHFRKSHDLSFPQARGKVQRIDGAFPVFCRLRCFHLGSLAHTLRLILEAAFKKTHRLPEIVRFDVIGPQSVHPFLLLDSFLFIVLQFLAYSLHASCLDFQLALVVRRHPPPNNTSVAPLAAEWPKDPCATHAHVSNFATSNGREADPQNRNQRDCRFMITASCAHNSPAVFRAQRHILQISEDSLCLAQLVNTQSRIMRTIIPIYRNCLYVRLRAC